ncbi:MAG: hypothetical protein RMJ15_05185 [Nitrososphaerota archaeon]|nr:hypothetical protein [Nitrososphaerota archaeon]
MVDQKRLEEAFRLLDAGKESLRSLEAKLGVSKSTLQRWYISWLDKRVEERKKALTEVEDKISKLTLEFNKLERKYDEKNRILEEAYRKKKAHLEEEIAKLRREAETIKAIFERQKLSWEEGMNILKDAASLRGMVIRLRSEASSLEDLVKQTRLSISELEKRRENLSEVVSALSSTYSSYMNWLQTEAPRLERLKKQLSNDIKGLNVQKTSLENEIAKLKGELKRLKQEEEARKALILALVKEEAKVKKETDGLMREAEELANRIVKSAKSQEEKARREAERLRKEKEKLEAEMELAQTALKAKLKDLWVTRWKSNHPNGHMALNTARQTLPNQKNKGIYLII